MVFTSTLLTVLSIFILLLAGYSAKKIKVLRGSDVAVINAILINLTMPAFIFVNTHSKPFTIAMAKAPVVIFVVEVIVLIIAYFISRILKLDRPTTGAFLLACAFGNTGFLGYPVVLAAFPNDGVAILTAVMLDQFGMALVLITVGVAISIYFSGSKFRWDEIKKFFKSPLLPSLLIALSLRKINVPVVIIDTLTYMAYATVPLAMISIGLSLSSKSVTRYPLPLFFATILKMALMPLLMYYILPIVGVDGTEFRVAVLSSAMPPAVFTGIIASKFGSNGAFSAAAVFIMSLLSIIILPFVLHLIS